MTVSVELLPHLRRAWDVADRNYAEALDLTAPAAAAGVSKYHFLRCFAAAYGETPMQYVTRRRIERASDLLRATNLTVTEVCTLVGYSSLGSFSQRFTELVGMTPTEHQRTRTGARIPGCFVFMLGLDSAIPAKLMLPGAPMDEESAGWIRRIMAKGSMHGVGLATDDCRKTFAELTAKGVEYLQEPSDRPYGVEAVLRDNSGNWLVLVEQRPYSAADFD